jgi:hypothetical protein
MRAYRDSVVELKEIRFAEEAVVGAEGVDVDVEEDRLVPPWFFRGFRRRTSH